MATIINGDGIVTAEGTSTTQGRLRLGEDTDNGTNYVELQAAANIASNVTFTLPSADGTSGQFLSTNGSGALSWAAASGGFSQAQVFTTSGTFTVPSSGKFKVTIVGGGGGGGRGNSNPSGAGAGGGGGSVIKWYSGITPGTVCTVTIGSGGAGATSQGSAGTSGGTSSFTGSGVTTLTASGGTGGDANSGVISTGGSASGGDINLPGGDGSAGQDPTINGGAYGGSVGGATLLGFSGAAGAATTSGNGKGYGAGGGSGGGNESSGVTGAGGNGTAGICIVEF